MLWSFLFLAAGIAVVSFAVHGRKAKEADITYRLEKLAERIRTSRRDDVTEYVIIRTKLQHLKDERHTLMTKATLREVCGLYEGKFSHFINVLT